MPDDLHTSTGRPETAPDVSRAETSVTALRIVVAAVLIIHGVARTALGIVDDFGGFLGSVGFPAGTTIAWVITVTEVLGGLAMASGRWVRPLALYFAAQLAVGIILVHASEGWFVVGAGRNGAEFSVVLIAVLLAVAYASPWSESPKP